MSARIISVAGSRRLVTMRGEVCPSLFEGTENDFLDAEAIAEAVQRPTMKFVATKNAGNGEIGRASITHDPPTNIAPQTLNQRTCVTTALLNW